MKKLIRKFLDSQGYHIVHKHSIDFERLNGGTPVKMGTHSFKCDLDNFDFWQRVNSNEWEPETFTILSKYIKPDSIYFDVGAWIGPTVLYASQLAKQVYCFEPDPIAYKNLLINLQTNGITNVQPFNVGFSNESGIKKVSSFGDGLGDSMTSLLSNADNGSYVNFVCMQFEHLVEHFKLPAPDVLKIDIEGGEFDLIPTLQNFLKANKPTLYLSTHTPYLPEEQRKAAMQKIVNGLTMYDRCISDSEMSVRSDSVKIAVSDMTQDKYLNNFSSFIFEPS